MADDTWHVPTSMLNMSDQEIRVRALECVCRLYAVSYDDIMAEAKFTQFWNRLREFEAYIRDGR